ncbi:MAG TPA: bacillithiol biosynthesis cysteine-adding enzyme BshC [Bacteroidia bacterium]|jgi:bacillithiol biosynthesis cysteine-adding enzyme BshC|nr:bacillithiol biosynthesis cysteine-adding enzyme BshC [Bacteroidia bacterium]
MPLSTSTISFEKTRVFSKLFLDYTQGRLKEFYAFEPSLDGIKNFTGKNKYETLNRAVLVEELKKQNSGLKISEFTKKNIESLSDKNTFTITTGHQLCLATGPLYFIYKILSVINLCEKLNAQNDKKFVPVYWMASEDHDFEEVNHINLFNKKFTWNTEQKGKVGEFSLENINLFLDEVKDVLGENKNAETVLSILKEAYSKKNLADATRYLVNELFGKYGLIILDGNSKTLKQEFIPEIKKDIFEGFAFKQVNSVIEKLKQRGYDAQVTPREINSFYAVKNLRERIVEENGKYKVLNTELSFTKTELEKLIETETEKFSPNVVLRPLYQQKILPNAVYVGGPGEIAYWLQYKTMFEEAGITLPVLIPRNFVLYIEKGLQQRIEKLNLKTEDFFGEKEKLIKGYALKQQPFDLNSGREELKKTFEKIKVNISKVDKTLEAATDAELQKNIKSLEVLEQKAIRSIKQKNEQSLNQIEVIYGRVLPNNIPQERVENFLRYYLSNPNFIEDVRSSISSQPVSQSLLVLTEV